MSFGEPNQIKLVFLALAEPSLRIAVGPQFALNDVFEARDFDALAKDLGLYGAGQKCPVSFSSRELDP
jgi:hypothetical protein